MCVYIYMYRCIYVCMYMQVCIYVFNLRTYVCMYIKQEKNDIFVSGNCVFISTFVWCGLIFPRIFKDLFLLMFSRVGLVD